jgi:hypothetical protein
VSAPAWPRPQWHDSGEEAFLLWFVFGDFEPDLRIDAQKYRTRGLPSGIDAVRYSNRALEHWDGYPLAGTLGRLLWDEDARLFERAKAARECWMLRGGLHDPPDLDGLRDVVGSIAALCDGGGIAVVDPQILSMFEAGDWKRRFFTRDAFDARDHVLILCDDDERHTARMRVHTRGLRKFARPDVEVCNVPAEATSLAGELAARFVEFQCAGGVVGDGHAVEFDDAPEGLVARVAGNVTDPAFNNRHLALRWPD